MKNKRVHFDLPGHAHELTFSCYRGRKFLRRELYCQFLARAINQAREKLRFSLWAYVFMPEHAHLLLYPQNDTCSIAEILQGIKQSCARRVMIHCRQNEPSFLQHFATGLISKPYRFWQDGGGYDRNIIDELTLNKSIKYIHDNPVRHCLVASPEEWHWSSFNEWHTLGKGPIPIDKANVLC